jgi:hypothetical protein
VNTLSKNYVEYLVVPKWSMKKGSDATIGDLKIAQMKENAEKRGVKVVDY